MIDGVGDNKVSRVGPTRVGLERATPIARLGDSRTQERVGSPVSPAADMAAAGPPVNADKVATIRAAIAEGRYPVDPDKIAERMIALDLKPEA